MGLFWNRPAPKKVVKRLARRMTRSVDAPNRQARRGKLVRWKKRYQHRDMLWRRLVRGELTSPPSEIERYGGQNGGWLLPSDLITPNWLVYDFGVGDDISFDIALRERHGCTIHAFDPTPDSVAFMADRDLPGLHFHPVGVWNEDTTIRFWVPRYAERVSYSALNLRLTSDYVDCPVKTIRSLAAELGHEHIDLIKMDIEGAEQLVIPNMIADRIRPTVLCVEYDQPYEVLSRLSLRCFRAALRLHRALLDAGYRPICEHGFDMTYLLGAYF